VRAGPCGGESRRANPNGESVLMGQANILARPNAEGITVTKELLLAGVLLLAAVTLVIAAESISFCVLSGCPGQD